MPLGYQRSPAQRGGDPEPDHTMLCTKVAPNDRPLVREKPRLVVTDIGSPPSVKLTMGMRVGVLWLGRKGHAAPHAVSARIDEFQSQFGAAVDQYGPTIDARIVLTAGWSGQG